MHQLRLKRIELKEYCISKEIFDHLCQTFLYRLALEDYTGRKIKIGGSQQSILNTKFPCCFFFSKNFSPRDLQDSPFISDLCWNLRFSWLSCSKQLASHSVGDQQLGVCCLILSKPPHWFLAGHTARLSLKLGVTICYWDLSNGMWVKCAKLPCTLLPFSPFKASFSHVDEENILWLHNNERKEPNSLDDLVYHNGTSKQDPFLQRPDSTLCSVGQMMTVTTIQFCHCSVKAVIATKQMEVAVFQKNFIYRKRQQARRGLWPNWTTPTLP